MLWTKNTQILERKYELHVIPLIPIDLRRRYQGICLHWGNLAAKFIEIRTPWSQIYTCWISLDFKPCSDIQKHRIVGKVGEKGSWSIHILILWKLGLYRIVNLLSISGPLISYFSSKHAGTCATTAFLRHNSEASQKGSSTFDPCSTWIKEEKNPKQPFNAF